MHKGLKTRSNCYDKRGFRSDHCFTSMPDIVNEKLKISRKQDICSVNLVVLCCNDMFCNCCTKGKIIFHKFYT